MTGERVDVLRLGYRLGRDPRITTHLALVGRALGADRFLLAGDEDPKMFENLESVADRFGGGMETEHIHSPPSARSTISRNCSKRGAASCGPGQASG